MPILYFLPWCRLSERLDVHPVSFIPFNRVFPPSDFDDATARLISSISENFIAIDGNPVSESVEIHPIKQRITKRKIPRGGSANPIQPIVTRLRTDIDAILAMCS